MLIRNPTVALVLLTGWLGLAVAATNPAVPALRAQPVPKPALRNALKDARAAQAARATAPVIPAELPLLTAEQIVERNVAARGGQAAWQKVHAMTLTGKLDAGKVRKDGGQVAALSAGARALAKAEVRAKVQQGVPLAQANPEIQLPFQMDMQRPNLTRLEVPFRGETAVQVYDGVNGWKLRPFLGRHEVEPFTDSERKIAAGQQQLDGPLINHKAKGTRVEVEGGEMLEGRGAYRLKLTLKGGAVRHLWVDAKTFLDVKIDSEPRLWDGKLHNVVTWLRDYRPVDGLQIAHRLETRIEGTPVSDSIYIDKVALNPVADDARFAKPE
jgi:hypothetical protein